MSVILELIERKTVGSHAGGRLRKEGFVPGVIYGPKEKPISVAVSMVAFLKAWKEAGESTVVTVKGLTEDKEVLIHDVDLDPVRDTPRHVDFLAIEKGKKVEVAVPLNFTGVAPVEKELGGIVIKVLHEIEIEAMPKDLPHEVVVDLSVLTTFDSQILVQDVVFPSGVTAVSDPEEVVATVSHATVEEETPAEAPDLSSIAISEERGKKEEEGESDAS